MLSGWKVAACSSVALVLFAGLVFGAANNTTGNVTATQNLFQKNLEGWEYALIMFLTLVVFLSLVYIGYKSNSSLNKGEMRRAIAGTFVASFVFLIFVLLRMGYSKMDNVITSFLGILGAIIGFYFGSRTALGNGREEFVGIENVEFTDGKVKVGIRNGGMQSVIIDSVYINSTRVYKDRIAVPPRSVVDVSLDFGYKAGEKYRIKACTTTGISHEVEAEAPGGGEE